MNNSRLSFAPLTRKIPECVSHSVCARHVTENSAGFVFVKAFVAIDRTVFRRMERNFRLLAAISANSFKHYFRLVAVHPGFTCGTAMRAAFRLIGEAFFGIEFLFRSGKNKFFAALHAFQVLVFKHHTVTPFLCIP